MKIFTLKQTDAREVKIAMKKYVSQFVIRQRSLQLRARFKATLWDSLKLGTYIRKKHGAL